MLYLNGRLSCFCFFHIFFSGLYIYDFFFFFFISVGVVSCVEGRGGGRRGGMEGRWRKKKNGLRVVVSEWVSG